MTTVDLLQREVNDASREMKKLHTISQQLEVDKMVLEDKVSSIKEFIEANDEDIVKRKKEFKTLMAKLEKAKQEIEPLKGQLAFVSTGYKEVVQI